MLKEAYNKLNDLGKVYFDIEFENKEFYKGVRFTQSLKPIYINEMFDNRILYDYDKVFECFDRDDTRVIIEFNQSFKLVSATHEDGSDMTEYWLERLSKFLLNNTIAPPYRDIQEAFVTEYFTHI